MYVTKNQIFVFIACYAFGCVVGVSFGIIDHIKKIIKVRFLGVVLEVLNFFIVSIIYLLYSHALRFPNFRLYMIIGVFLGVLSYLKSLHIIVAKCLQKVYNIIVKIKNKKDKKWIKRKQKG